MGGGLQPVMSAQEAQAKRMEENKKKQEEAKQKVAEMQAKVAEQKAIQQKAAEARVAAIKSANEIRKIVMKVKQATADNFDEAQKELQAILEAELPNCGEQTERISQESEQAIE